MNNCPPITSMLGALLSWNVSMSQHISMFQTHGDVLYSRHHLACSQHTALSQHFCSPVPFSNIIIISIMPVFMWYTSAINNFISRIKTFLQTCHIVILSLPYSMFSANVVHFLTWLLLWTTCLYGIWKRKEAIQRLNIDILKYIWRAYIFKLYRYLYGMPYEDVNALKNISHFHCYLSE